MIVNQSIFNKNIRKEIYMGKILVEKENIYLGLETVTKEEAIRFAGHKLIEAGYVKEAYVDSMLNREKILSTYMGHGLAIPHGDRDSKDLILKSGIVILQYKNGIKFEDGKVAEIIIGCAGKGNDHLKILAGLASMFKNSEVMDIFTSTNSADAIYNYLIKFIK